MYIVKKVGDTGTFKEKLDLLVTNGYLAKKNKSIIETALEAGHASNHRGFLPNSDMLNTVMDILENLVQQEHLNQESELIKQKIPKRS